MRQALLYGSALACLLLGWAQADGHGFFHRHYVTYAPVGGAAFVPMTTTAFVPMHTSAAFMSSAAYVPSTSAAFVPMTTALVPATTAYTPSLATTAAFGCSGGAAGTAALVPASAPPASAAGTDVLSVLDRLLPLLERWSNLRRPPSDSGLGDSLSRRLDTIDSRLDSLDRRITALERRVSGRGRGGVGRGGNGGLREDPGFARGPGASAAATTGGAALGWEDALAAAGRASVDLARVEATYREMIAEYAAISKTATAEQKKVLDENLAWLRRFLERHGRVGLPALPGG
jgi:hypothetical protein